MMRTVLKKTFKLFGLGVYAHTLVVTSGLLHAFYWAEGDEISRPDRSMSSEMVAKQTEGTSVVVGAVLTMYSEGCVDKDSFSPDVTFEDPVAKCKGVCACMCV